MSQKQRIYRLGSSLRDLDGELRRFRLKGDKVYMEVSLDAEKLLKMDAQLNKCCPAFWACRLIYFFVTLALFPVVKVRQSSASYEPGQEQEVKGRIYCSVQNKAELEV